MSAGGPAATYEVGQTQENLEQHIEDTLRFDLQQWGALGAQK